MRKGFMVYEESFYMLLKRYDQLESNSTGVDNEKLNLLNKIRLLAECLENDLFHYNFTKKLIKDRSENIIQMFEDIKINCPREM